MEVYAVSAVTAYLRQALELDPLLADLWIEGEASNVVRSAAGHLYFTLKDSESALRCVMFRGRGRAIPIANGDQVIAHGRMSVYEPRGDLQLLADLVQAAGLGELQLRYEQLRAQLDDEGLFDLDRKRPIPPFPERIGIVTSPTGAVLHDIQTVIERRYPLVELILAPCLVQGDGAPDDICRAIRGLNEIDRLDLIIVARGGGSLEDLWAFNDERVARAIFASRVPVISAVGHETDTTIADYVADLRAPTPSVAAELAVPDLDDLRDQLDLFSRQLGSQVAARLADLTGQIQFLRHRLDRAAPDLDRHRQHLDEMAHRLRERTGRDIDRVRARIDSLLARLQALSVTATLARGYAIVERPDGFGTVWSVDGLKPGDRLALTVVDGQIHAEIETVQPRHQEVAKTGAIR